MFAWAYIKVALSSHTVDEGPVAEDLHPGIRLQERVLSHHITFSGEPDW